MQVIALDPESILPAAYRLMTKPVDADTIMRGFVAGILMIGVGASSAIEFVRLLAPYFREEATLIRFLAAGVMLSLPTVFFVGGLVLVWAAWRSLRSLRARN